MKQEIMQVCSAFRISGHEKLKVPADVLENKIYNELAHTIAHYIVENINKVPATIEVRPFIEQDWEEYILRANLISNEELRRLKNIEHEYSKYLGYGGTNL
jgi:hypothetical protein